LASPNHKVKEYRGRCMISKAFSDIDIEVPFDEIYSLMKDFL
jgi:hypothetical protein